MIIPANPSKNISLFDDKIDLGETARLLELNLGLVNQIDYIVEKKFLVSKKASEIVFEFQEMKRTTAELFVIQSKVRCKKASDTLQNILLIRGIVHQ